MQNDTIELLKECNAGVKMGVSSIEDVLDKVESGELKAVLTKNKEEHQELGSRLHEILNEYDEPGKDPNLMARGMSWMKTNVMMQMDYSDHTIADVMTDGCNMGVKSLNRYLNKYQTAEKEAKDICEDLISLEQNLTQDLRKFL